MRNTTTGPTVTTGLPDLIPAEVAVAAVRAATATAGVACNVDPAAESARTGGPCGWTGTSRRMSTRHLDTVAEDDPEPDRGHHYVSADRGAERAEERDILATVRAARVIAKGL